MAGYVFRQSSFSQGAIATHLPHFANPLDFDGTKFAVIETANFRFCKISVFVHGTARHENVTVGIALIALRIRMMQTHANGRTVFVAQLKTEPAQQIPLRLRIQFVGQGHVHGPAHASVPTPFGLLRTGIAGKLPRCVSAFSPFLKGSGSLAVFFPKWPPTETEPMRVSLSSHWERPTAEVLHLAEKPQQ